MKIKTSIAALLFGLSSFAVGSSPAEAVAGCDSQVQTRMSQRAQDTYFVQIVGGRVTMRITGSAGYWHCPNGDASGRMKNKWIEWCWAQVSEEDNHRQFDGVTFNIRIGNSNGIQVNPGPFKVPDDGSRQNCKLQNIGDDIEEWLYYFNDPKWAASFTINLVAMNDQSHDFGENAAGDGGTWKYFKPGSDTLVKDWWR